MLVLPGANGDVALAAKSHILRKIHVFSSELGLRKISAQNVVAVGSGLNLGITELTAFWGRYKIEY
jgi:hypothetical protein